MARVTLDRNVKFKRLVRELSLPRPYVRGLLETMWDCAHECGDPVLGNADDVEHAAEWPGDPGLLFDALREGGWIDQVAPDSWEIHDYWDHAPDYVRKRRQREQQRREKGANLRNGGQRQTTADNGRQRRTTAPNGRPPTPTPTQEYSPPPHPPSHGESSVLADEPRPPDPSLAPTRTGRVEVVWSTYLEAHTGYHRRKSGKPAVQPKLTAKRRRTIRARLAENGGDVSELQDAARGVFVSDFNTGKNDQGKEYLSPDLVFRDAEHVERYAEAWRRRLKRGGPSNRTLDGAWHPTGKLRYSRKLEKYVPADEYEALTSD